MPILKSTTILDQIGNTPLVRLEALEEKGFAAIYAKVDIDALRQLALAWPGGAR